jgi:hypothetical protein
MAIRLDDRFAASPDAPQDSKAENAPQEERDDLNVGPSPRLHRLDPLVPFLAVMIDEVAHEKPEKEKPKFDDRTQKKQQDKPANVFNECPHRAALICEKYYADNSGDERSKKADQPKIHNDWTGYIFQDASAADPTKNAHGKNRAYCKTDYVVNRPSRLQKLPNGILIEKVDPCKNNERKAKDGLPPVGQALAEQGLLHAANGILARHGTPNFFVTHLAN